MGLHSAGHSVSYFSGLFDKSSISGTDVSTIRCFDSGSDVSQGGASVWSPDPKSDSPGFAFSEARESVVVKFNRGVTRFRVDARPSKPHPASPRANQRGRPGRLCPCTVRKVRLHFPAHGSAVNAATYDFDSQCNLMEISHWAQSASWAAFSGSTWLQLLS